MRRTAPLRRPPPSARRRPFFTSRPAPVLGGLVQRQQEAQPMQSSELRLEMRKPHRFPQEAQTCWASAIASWLLVKGLVKKGFSDQYLIDYYADTSCVDSDGALVGEDTIEDVFAEWRLELELASGAGIPHIDLDFKRAKRLLERHGHVILVTESGLLHVVVVYGIVHHSRDDPYGFSFLVVDPLGKSEKIHWMFLNDPVQFAFGRAKPGPPAPCRTQ